MSWHPSRRVKLASGLLILLMTPSLPAWAARGPVELWLSISPAAGHHSGAPDGKAVGQSGGQRGGDRMLSGGHGDHESEHRPQALRTYWLNSCSLSPMAEAFAVRPEGQTEDLAIERQEHEVKVNLPTPMGEGPAHGANNLYLVDRQVVDGRLQVSTAKWLTINHNCGWGHDHKFNPARMKPQFSDRAPLEIVAEDLWDKNFHSNVMSGDLLRFRVLSYGRPAPGATVEIETERGWRKRLRTDIEGNGSVQLVRDYYPEGWGNFQRTRPARLKISARYESGEKGEYNSAPYNGVEMLSTFSWRYYPPRRDYVSWAGGLLLGAMVMLFSGFGIFLYRERRRKPYREWRFDERA